MNIDFYVRIFVRVYTSASEVKKAATKVSQVFQCVGCDSYWLQPICKALDTPNGNFKYTPAVFSLNSAKCDQCGSPLKVTKKYNMLIFRLEDRYGQNQCTILVLWKGQFPTLNHRTAI